MDEKVLRQLCYSLMACRGCTSPESRDMHYTTAVFSVIEAYGEEKGKELFHMLPGELELMKRSRKLQEKIERLEDEREKLESAK